MNKSSTLRMAKAEPRLRCQCLRTPPTLILILSILFSPMALWNRVIADGCNYPLDAPNPMCFYIGEGCVKWVHDPVPQTCDGIYMALECLDYVVNGSLTVYTKDGDSEEDCDCGSESWEYAGGPHQSPIHRKYNGTFCGG